MASTALISESLLHQWSEQGSSKVRAQLQAALKAIHAAPNASSIAPADRQTLYRLLYELVWIVLRAKLPRQDVLTVLNDVDLAKSPAACDVLVDLLWVIGSEVEAKEKGHERFSSSEWQSLVRLVRDLADEEIVPSMSLQGALEVDLLHQAGLLAEPTAMAKKLIRVNTKTYYTQVKFNLLREEGEGFSKVLSLLHTGVTKDQIEATKVDLMSLIGYFDLDANRVLDLALDAYEMQPQNAYFADLLSTFKRDSIPHVLGFKFQFYKRDMLDGLVTPKSLYRLAATLIEKKLLDVDCLMPHLSPNKEETVKLALEKVKEQEQAAKAFGKVNLAAKVSDTEAAPDNEQIEADLLAAATKKKNEDNQVLGLIMGMVDVGAHERAFEMIKWFKDRGVDALTHEPLMKQMCQFVHLLLNHLYEPLSLKSMQFSSASGDAQKLSSTTPSSNVKVKALSGSSEWLGQLLAVLKVLGGNLHNDSFLFTKILRVITHHIEQASKNSTLDESEELKEQLKALMTQSFLPALSLQSCNPSTAFMVWDLLKNQSFDERYRLYQQWEALYSASPAMQLVEAQCVQGTRKIMRRLTADRAKPSARSLTHIAHSNPLVVFRTMLRQIQSYDNLILPVVECLKFITPLGMDTLSYVLVSELSKSRQSIKSDGTNISMWLQSLANFSGSFYRKYPNVELGGLLQYLIRRLENWESVDLVVLSELLSKMGSCITFEDISAAQLEAQAGGPHLWQEPTDPKLTNRRAIPRLRDALIKRSLALPLCLLICQVRSKMEFQEDSSLNHLKALGRMFDTSQMTLSQLLQFLNGVVDPAVYTKMLPSVSELVQNYHILPELAMTLCRPAIRSEDAIFKRAPRSVHTSQVASTPVAQENGSIKSWDMQSGELLDDVARAISSAQSSKDPFAGMSKELYTMFWSMILYDIYVPFQQYDAEINRLRASVASQNASGSMTTSERNERKKLKEKMTQTIDKLVTEQKDQVAHRKRVYERLEEKKEVFFKREDTQSQTAVSELLQKCIIPRALLSPEDALFCAKFMERLHHMNTPEFSTVQYYNKVTLQLPSIVLCVTEREAGNFGIFLKETMGLLYRWNQSSVTYDEEAIHGKSGFSVDLHNPAKVLTHRQYKSMYAKCHRSMVQLYCKTLGSGEYMPIRNSLIVLTKLIDVFPSGKTAAECLLEIVEALTQEEREDIKIMARRYFALLTKRKGTLVEDKMLAAGLTPPKKKPVEAPSKSAADDKEDGGSVREKSHDNDTGSRDSRDRERGSSVRDGRRGDSRSAQSSRGDRRDTSESRDDPLESGEVKSDSTNDRSDRATSSSASNPKRRDDRAQDGDGKRDRRGGNDRDSRDTSGSAQKGRSDAAGERGRQNGQSDKRESGGARDSSRRSRSRSPDSRRPQRDRERGASVQTEQKDKEVKESVPTQKLKESTPPTPAKRDAPTSQNSGRPSSTDAKESLSGNKRQRADASEDEMREKVELSEAALRRQLTEKRNQGRQEARKSASDGASRDEKSEGRKSTSDTPARDTKAEVSKPVTPPIRREAERSSGTADATKDEARPEPVAKKIVSLVSSASARKRERDTTDDGSPSTPKANDAGATHDAKRRREGGGEKGNGSARDDAGNRSGRGEQPQQQQQQQQLQRRNSGNDNRHKHGQQQQNRGNSNNQMKQKSEGGGGNNSGQQREQGRNNRQDGRAGGGGGGNRGDNRGGNNNNDRRRDSNNNNDRRGGGGGGGSGGINNNGGGRR